MHAKFVYEAFTEKSDPIRDMGIGVKRYRKGDKVRYEYWHPASSMDISSKPEQAPDKIGWISKVNEVIAEPFTNNTRNQPIRGTYPLSRIQYEDVDKPEPESDPDADWEMPMYCPVCNDEVLPGEFVDGVCKKCAAQGIYVDKFGTRHKGNSRINTQKYVY